MALLVDLRLFIYLSRVDLAGRGIDVCEMCDVFDMQSASWRRSYVWSVCCM